MLNFSLFLLSLVEGSICWPDCILTWGWGGESSKCEGGGHAQQPSCFEKAKSVFSEELFCQKGVLGSKLATWPCWQTNLSLFGELAFWKNFLGWES